MDLREVTCRCGHKSTIPASEMGKWLNCPACKSEFPVNPQNSSLLHDHAAVESLWGEDSEPAAAPKPDSNPGSTHTTPPQHRPAPETASRKLTHCSQCRKPFRGEWDRVAVSGAYLCHICSNRIENSPSKSTRPAIEKAEPPSPAAPVEETPKQEEDQRRRKGLLTLLGVGAILLAIAMLLPVEVWITQLLKTGQDVRTGAVALSPAWRYVIIGLHMLADYSYFVVLLTLIQWMSNQITERHFISDVLENALHALLLFLIFLPYYFAPLGLVAGTITLVQCFALLSLGQFSILQTVAFAVLSLTLSTALSTLIRDALTGLVAGLAL